MRQIAITLLVTSLCGPLAISAGDDTPAFRNDLLRPLAYAEQEVLALAKAMPADKYGWRPGQGVRSVGEVYQHIANGNRLILTFAGEKPLARKELNQMIQDNTKLEQTVTDKDQILANLKESFDQARAVIMKASQADLERPIKFFNADGTVRGVLISLIGHVNEHLGQSIAYARVNGIVPPWSKGQ